MFGFRLRFGPFYYNQRLGGHGRRQGPGLLMGLLWLLLSPLILTYYVVIGMALAVRWGYRLIATRKGAAR